MIKSQQPSEIEKMLKSGRVTLKYLIQIKKEVESLRIGTKEVLTLKEASIYTEFSKSYIYRLVNGGKIEYSKPSGKSIFFERKTLENWLMSKKFSTRNQNQEKARKFLK